MDVVDTINAYFDVVARRLFESPENAIEIAEAARQAVMNIVLIGINDATVDASASRCIQATWITKLVHTFDESGDAEAEATQ